MSIGDDLRDGFLTAFEMVAGEVTVFRDYGTLEQKSLNLSGIKGNDENRVDKVLFQFAEQEDIQIRDVIQQKGSRDLWEVYETEDTVAAGTFLNFTAKVRRLPGASLPPANRGNAAITVHGDVFGGLQVNTTNSSQTIGVTNISKVESDAAKLKELLQDNRISSMDREDATQALDRVVELSKRVKSGDVISRTKEKLDFVKSVCGVAKDLAVIATPLIDHIANHLNK